MKIKIDPAEKREVLPKALSIDPKTLKSSELYPFQAGIVLSVPHSLASGYD